MTKINKRIIIQLKWILFLLHVTLIIFIFDSHNFLINKKNWI